MAGMTTQPMTNVPVVFHYARCSTCRKARRWLEAHEISVRWVDIVASPPSRDQLLEAIQRSGQPVGKFFNTSGQSYQRGGFAARRKTMDESECVEALAADGKLIRRPLVLAPDFALVGFRPDAWAEAWGVPAAP